jgi:NNP family nitrate/nitrite transporter-like MFS transporter
MDKPGKATRIELFRFDTIPMRAFHMTWAAFFLCFFSWFAVAPLMVVVRKDLGLTAAQVGNVIIASVAATIVARLAVGWLCDRFGPRRTYAVLLALGALPVMSIGLARSYRPGLRVARRAS